MQVRIPPGSVKALLSNAGCKILRESEKQIAAVKPTNIGRVVIRVKRQSAPYALEERHYWLADIHFERGILPTPFFDSKEVRDFVKRYVEPFTNPPSKPDVLSLQIDGIESLKLHEREELER